MNKTATYATALTALATAGVAASSLLLVRSAPAEAPPAYPVAWEKAHRVEPTRLLRRGMLALANRPPTADEYAAVLAKQGANARAEEVYRQLEALLDGDAFDDVIYRWGFEVLRTISYDWRFDFVNRDFDGHYGLELQRCPDGTLHAGAYGFLNDLPSYGEPWATCDESGADVRDIEPWWAPGTTVTMIGAAGRTDVREVDGTDCGRVSTGRSFNAIVPAAAGCSCGPNLIYCWRRGFEDHSNYDSTGARRSAFEEPARLLRHIVREDRPLSDLVLGDYTVVNRGLHYMYTRAGRQNASNAFLDDSTWFRDYGGDDDWREIKFEDMHPNLLSDRDIRFDPRTDSGEPPGIPAAGVLSTLGSNYAFPRERVRGARWLEIFACREFSPPPADVEFNPYQRDPGTEGTCEHCHQLIDPAAMHFKRMFGGGAEIGGIGSWSLSSLPTGHTFAERSISTFEYDTLMTPVEQIRLEEAPDASLLDFLPDNYSLFGRQGDGTIGPLGFAKILVDAGEFDTCMVRRIHELVAGRDLVPGTDDRQLDALVKAFVDADRSTKALIRAIVRSDEFTIGW